MNKELISIEEATEEEKKRKELEGRLSKQEQLSWHIIVGVAIAFLFTLGLVGVEVMLFHTRADKDYLELQNMYFQEVRDLKEKIFEMELRIQMEINDLKTPVVPNPTTKKP